MAGAECDIFLSAFQRRAIETTCEMATTQEISEFGLQLYVAVDEILKASRRLTKIRFMNTRFGSSFNTVANWDTTHFKCGEEHVSYVSLFVCQVLSNVVKFS